MKKLDDDQLEAVWNMVMDYFENRDLPKLLDTIDELAYTVDASYAAYGRVKADRGWDR